MAHIKDLVDDIYGLFETGALITDEQAEALGKAMAFTIKDQLKAHRTPRSGEYLRVSNLGKPLRQTWYSLKGYKREPINAPTKIKFIYGHILEDMLLHMAEWAGHTVTHKQHEIDIDGVKGHMDAVIDGAVVDVKSAAPRSFEKKFKQEGLTTDDPYGYITQISSYSEALGKDEGHFLAINKDSGELKLLTIDEMEFEDPHEKIKEHREALAKDTPPAKCYGDPVPFGKSGNLQVPTGCKWCDFKANCYPDARVFDYSYGPVWLTQVNNEPRVEEITDDTLDT